MPAAGWVVVGIAGWCLAAVLAGLFIGAVVRLRDTTPTGDDTRRGG